MTQVTKVALSLGSHHSESLNGFRFKRYAVRAPMRRCDATVGPDHRCRLLAHSDEDKVEIAELEAAADGYVRLATALLRGA